MFPQDFTKYLSYLQLLSYNSLVTTRKLQVTYNSQRTANLLMFKQSIGTSFL